MKRAFLLLLVALTFSSVAMADETDRFLEKFTTFVEKVTDTDSNEIGDKKLATFEEEYDEFLEQYKNTYKSKMSQKQIEKFNTQRAKYQKKVLTIKAKRKGSAMKGWLKGMMNKD